jgi:hypothetical protein
MIAAVIHVVGETRSFERAGKKGSIPKVLGTKKRKKKKGSIPKVLGGWVVCGRDQSRKGWGGWGLGFSGKKEASQKSWADGWFAG